jgi:hypothetical protein
VLEQVRRVLDREGLWHREQIEQGWAWAMYGTAPADQRVAQALAHHPRVWVSPEAFQAIVDREAADYGRACKEQREAAEAERAQRRIAVEPVRVAVQLRFEAPEEPTDLEETEEQAPLVPARATAPARGEAPGGARKA